MDIARNSHGKYHLIYPNGIEIGEYLENYYKERIKLLPPNDFLTLAKALESRIRIVLKNIFPELEIGQINFELTGDYTGDFMLEYEINPAVGATTVYWPDPTKFSDAHIDRFTLSNPSKLVEMAIFGFLTDYPHEIGHVLQQLFHQVIKTVDDDGWLAEHDPSTIALNLLSEALRVPTSDEFSDIPALFETTYLWLHSRVIEYHHHESVQVSELQEYQRWKSSCGFHPPQISAASITADYAKIRAAVESYPLNLSDQLRTLYGDRRDCDIRTVDRPPLQACHVRKLFPYDELDPRSR
jgi:hypothetical protein